MFKIILFCIAKVIAGGFATTCGIVLIHNDKKFDTARSKVVGGILLAAGLMCLLSFII